jgi:dipeptidyl-peptidase-4
MPEGGGSIVTLTTLAGTHQPTVSPDGSTVALISSNDTTPADLFIVDGRGGSAPRRITSSPPAEFATYRWAQPRYVTFKSRIDDFTLHARVIEPPNLDKGRKYPVLFGPVYSNTVRNRWAGSAAAFQQFLALERGYIVVQVDVRGSTGYGRDFREKFLMDYGGKDLDDLQSALEYLKTVPYADTERAGLWGSSYGGLLTTYMLFKKPGVFKAGVAGASAVDPRFFGEDDVAITRLPNTEPEAYRRGTAANYAQNLKDPLLFIHGMQDDVVPFKTIVDLMEQLILLGKDFDIAIAPGATHGWSQREHYAVFMYRKLLAHFDRHLRASPPSATSQ